MVLSVTKAAHNGYVARILIIRRRPEAVARALNLLLDEQKVERSPLDGYWKLNV